MRSNEGKSRISNGLGYLGSTRRVIILQLLWLWLCLCKIGTYLGITLPRGSYDTCFLKISENCFGNLGFIQGFYFTGTFDFAGRYTTVSNFFLKIPLFFFSRILRKHAIKVLTCVLLWRKKLTTCKKSKKIFLFSSKNEPRGKKNIVYFFLNNKSK